MSSAAHDVLRDLLSARDTILAIRAGMREMGERADVPIEPPEQQRLLDATTARSPAVLGAGVPGGASICAKCS